MELTFLRHAKTDLNGKGFIATNLDYPLNDLGKQKCAENIFVNGQFNSVYSSPFKRTIETAQIVYPYMNPIVTSLLTQRNLGELNEKKKIDYDEQYLKLVRNYLVNPKDSESLEHIIARLDIFFNYLKDNQVESDNVLVVTHNGIMRIIKKYYLKEQAEIDSDNLGQFQITLKKPL